MKKLFLLIFVIASFLSHAQEKESRSVKDIANQIIKAAEEKNHEELKGLCDPEGTGNQICAMESDEDKKKLNTYLTLFEGAEISGDPTYSKNESGDEIAKLPIQINVMGEKTVKSMKFIKRENIWYFLKF